MYMNASYRKKHKNINKYADIESQTTKLNDER